MIKRALNFTDFLQYSRRVFKFTDFIIKRVSNNFIIKEY
jgi:hypothetical protein